MVKVARCRFLTFVATVAGWVVPRGDSIDGKTKSELVPIFFDALADPEACLEAISLCFLPCEVRELGLPCFVILTLVAFLV